MGRGGLTKYGFLEDGLHRGTGLLYNERGFNIDGIHKDTGDKYDPDGFDIDYHDSSGFRWRFEIHRLTGTHFDPDGYDRRGYNRLGEPRS